MATSKEKKGDDLFALDEADQSVTVPQLNTLPRSFSPRPVEWGVNFRAQPEVLAGPLVLGGPGAPVDDEAVKAAQELNELNAKELPDLDGLDASFPGSVPALIFQPNPQTDAQNKVVPETDPAEIPVVAATTQ